MENNKKPPTQDSKAEPIVYVPQEVINDFEKIIVGLEAAQQEFHKVAKQLTIKN
jgi:hypothetical protein